MDIILLLLGSALGTLSRYFISVLAHQTTLGALIPLGTLMVNGLGCFLAGLLFHAAPMGGNWRLFMFTGFLGAFTTFSACSLETLIIWRNSTLTLALLNVLGNNLLSIGGVFAGYWIGKHFT